MASTVHENPCPCMSLQPFYIFPNLSIYFSIYFSLYILLFFIFFHVFALSLLVSIDSCGLKGFAFEIATVVIVSHRSLKISFGGVPCKKWSETLENSGKAGQRCNLRVSREVPQCSLVGTWTVVHVTDTKAYFATRYIIVMDSPVIPSDDFVAV